MQATNEYHWGKHYKTYVTNLNKQIEGKPLDSKSLEEVRPAAALVWVHNHCPRAHAEDTCMRIHACSCDVWLLPPGHDPLSWHLQLPAHPFQLALVIRALSGVIL